MLIIVDNLRSYGSTTGMYKLCELMGINYEVDFEDDNIFIGMWYKEGPFTYTLNDFIWFYNTVND